MLLGRIPVRSNWVFGWLMCFITWLIFFGSTCSVTERGMLRSPTVIVDYFCSVLSILFHLFWNSILGAYIFRIVKSSWWGDPFIILSLFILNIFLVLKSTLSDVNIETELSFDYRLHSISFFSYNDVLYFVFVFIFKVGFI